VSNKSSSLTRRDRFRHWFDSTLLSGTRGMILWLSLATLALIFIVGTIAAVVKIKVDKTPLTFTEAWWSSLMRTLDPGTMGGDEGWGLRIASFVVTIGGVLIVSSLIGLLANGISDRVAELRRGRSPVYAWGHTLILGWSPKIFPIISELVIANENQEDAAIVILGPLDKHEMERQLEARIGDTRGTKITCRTGTPFEPVDLEMARPHDAKAVIILNRGHEDGDAEVVKTALALLRTTQLDAATPVVAELVDEFTARALREGTDEAVTVVRPSGIIARVTAQVCRQPGLSSVYQELFDFAGHEIYFHPVPELSGVTFQEALMSFDAAIPLGIRYDDGTLDLNPPANTPFHKGDQVIAIAEDDDKIVFRSTQQKNGQRAARQPRAATTEPERILLIGWNRMAPEIVKELDSYVAPGSTLDVSVDGAVITAEEVDVPAGLHRLKTSVMDTALDPDRLRAMMSEGAPDHVIVLCYKERLSEAQADARVLLTLLHLRSAIDAAGVTTNIVAELLDERDVGLTPSRQRDEFIVSERLSALLMAQLSENRELAPVFDDLLDETGSEIYLKPVETYVQNGTSPTFGDIAGAAGERGEVALGYQVHNGEPVARVVINPSKSERIEFAPGDSVIVLAEEQN
jgi:ion channel POLLUX/CASTOR